jgi:hypothetical protein
MTTLRGMLDEPLDHPTVRRLSRQILRDGLVEWSEHALDEMEKDDLDELDCRNVIWAGEDGGCDPEGSKGEWRYRRRTPKIWVVIEFEPCACDPAHATGYHLVVVTAWRDT